MSSANSEQLKAIEHNGGVLLKAGAGSGKTFVLKEHMIYLTDKWILKFKEDTNQNDFEQYLKSKYSRIVLMTFTKKAAGEISIRLNNEFVTKAKNADGNLQKYWQKACELLDYLTVTTIHGFCFKLIKQGFFTNVDLDDDIINQAQYEETIREIFDLWLETELSKDENHEFVDLVIKDREHILQSIKSIFADPSLRKTWTSLNPDEMSHKDIQSSIKDLCDTHNLNKFNEIEVNLLAYDEFDGKTWYEFLKEFETVKEEINTLEHIISLYNFFKEKEFKIPVTPRAKAVEEHLKKYYVAIKELKDFLKSYGEDLYMFYLHKDGLVKDWYKKFCNVIGFVDRNYEAASGITFSDLEYVVSKGLEDQKVVDAISESYDYLIVDEFQDTSFIQFEILSKIIKNDYRKLFCVGDIKQAIYGFRGGELGVFLNCEKLVPKVYSLKNNYRSDKDIIEFNNNFFDFLFRKGVKFEGDDIKPVEVEYQEAPIEERADGKVYQVNVNAAFLEKFDIKTVSSSEIDYLEAIGLFKNIQTIIQQDDKKIAILYKKLKPSLLLIGLFIENSIGFTAQVKVPFGQDPILGLFKSLLEHDFNLNEKRSDYLRLILRAYLALINSTLQPDIDKTVNKFIKSQKFFGLYRAFYQFVDELGLANSNYKNNLNYIKSLCHLGKEDKEHILSLLNQESSNSYSLDFQFGLNPNHITIMTAHASKGLQYPHILLGGIYTNDKSFPFTSTLGKFPLSFKWGEKITSKKKYRTPQYLLESEVTKHAEFSESKRLFYVACTRAENTVGWVNIEFEKIKKRSQSGSWSNGFAKWLEEPFKDNNLIIQKVKSNSTEIDISDEFSMSFLEESSNRKPLFHIDDLGLVNKLSHEQSFILPELSVTRLATISECPRKFYLKNICKLSQSDIDVLAGDNVNLEHADEDVLSHRSFTSSSQRGSLIHESIDQVIKSGFELELDLSTKDKSSVYWAVENLQRFRDKFDFYSEQSIKFELFGYMISGIPDLILFPSNDDSTAEIWDYKTGSRSETKEVPYIFQLMTYAYALYEFYQYDKEKLINIVLCYVDQKHLVEQKVSYSDVEKYLSSYWQKINMPDEVNTDSCAQCPFDSICHK